MIYCEYFLPFSQLIPDGIHCNKDFRARTHELCRANKPQVVIKVAIAVSTRQLPVDGHTLV